ncbi:MAG TPA: bifunctional hydroxymethylpyrimidine kinase/phosphomethylpyrimidine kinase [Gemmatimonadaceae bacterium]|nr:bifunctional hydroxymethylpyrimidine kinase/phosphomethylpyrimidine kinase [Gemmatimonadaceae bacterium]
MRIALTIAGSDSGGGAGIQADLKTFQRFGVFGTSAITAVTAQNTRGVAAWSAVDPDLVRQQIDAVAADLRPHAVKSGMVATADVIHAVAAALRAHELRTYVLDPVLVATSGDRLIEEDAERALRQELLPLAALVTPNAREAAVLTGARVQTVGEMERAARALCERGARAALVTGGDVEGEEIADVLFDGASTHVFRHARIRTSSTHGTGCTLSAAIVAHLALSYPLRDAVARSVAYVQRAIETAPGLGSGAPDGHGPLNHLA